MASNINTDTMNTGFPVAGRITIVRDFEIILHLLRMR